MDCRTDLCLDTFATGIGREGGGGSSSVEIAPGFYRHVLKELAALHRVNLWGFRGILGLLRCFLFFPINFCCYTSARTPGFQHLAGRGWEWEKKVGPGGEGEDLPANQAIRTAWAAK